MSLHRSLAGVLVVSLAAVLCPSCADVGEDAWQPPTVVRVEGVKAAQVVSPAYGMIFGHAVRRTGETAAPLAPVEDATYALVRPDDLLALDGAPAFPYAGSDGETLAFTVEDGDQPARLLLAGETVAMALGPGDEAGWAWLREAPAEDLATVRFVMLESESATSEDDAGFSDVQRTALQRLAEANPDVGVMAPETPLRRAALKLFDSPWLHLGGKPPTAEVQDLLAAEPRLRTLMMEAKAETGLAFLSRLPHVRTLFLSGWKGEDKDTPPPALPTILSLRSLIVFGAEMKDLAPIGEQPNLVELALVSGGLEDLGRLAEMPALRSLSLQGCVKVKDLSALSGLTHLRWLGLPPKTTQEQFARICTEHPDLEILTAVGSENVTDLAPAAGLKRLRVLCVTAAAPLEPLARAGSLELLGVHTPKDAPEAEQEKMGRALVQMMEANPDLAVVRVSPLCLGSGWILLLVPATAGAWWLARRRRTGAAG